MPIETTIPVIIFEGGSFNFLSVTLEHKAPTKITLKMLQLFAVMTIG